MPNTTSFDFGDILLVAFPFTDQQRTKQRPTVVISSVAYNQRRPDVILMAITSRVGDIPEFGQHSIEHWADAGLLKPSVLKPVVFSVEQTLLRKKLGHLADPDLASLRTMLTQILG